MRSRIPAILATGLLAIPIVYAQSNFGEIGGLLNTLVGGIFGAIQTSPNIWFRTILALIILILMNLGLSQVGIFAAQRNGRITLSVVIGIAFAAAIPAEMIATLFNSIGMLAALVYTIPFIWLLLYGARQTEHSRARFGAIALLWAFMTWFYTTGVVNSSIPIVSWIIGLLGTASLIAMIWSIYKTLTGPSLRTNEQDTDRNMDREQRDLNEAYERAQESERAAEEARTQLQAQIQQTQQVSQQMQGFEQRFEQLQREADEDKQREAAVQADLREKLRIAEESRKNAESAAEQLRKAQEAQAAQQNAQVVHQAIAQKENEDKEQLQTLLSSVTAELEKIQSVARSATSGIVKTSEEMTELEIRVRKALEDLKTLQENATRVANIKLFDERVRKLNDAELTAKFVKLHEDLTYFKSYVDGLCGASDQSLKSKLEQYLEYYLLTHKQISAIAKRVQLRNSKLTQYISIIKTSQTTATRESLTQLLTRVQTVFVQQSAWFSGAKKEFDALNQNVVYQGKVTKVIEQNLMTTSSSVNGLHKTLFTPLEQAIAIFESDLKERETHKAQANAALGRKP